MNNNILLTVPLAFAPLLLALIARLALLLALFLALIVVVLIVNFVLQSILLSRLLHDYFMVQKRYLPPSSSAQPPSYYTPLAACLSR